MWYCYFYLLWVKDLNNSSATVKIPFKIYITVISSLHTNTFIHKIFQNLILNTAKRDSLPNEFPFQYAKATDSLPTFMAVYSFLFYFLQHKSEFMVKPVWQIYKNKNNQKKNLIHGASSKRNVSLKCNKTCYLPSIWTSNLLFVNWSLLYNLSVFSTGRQCF